MALTVPVSSATYEHILSAIQRIKILLRNFYALREMFKFFIYTYILNNISVECILDEFLKRTVGSLLKNKNKLVLLF